MPGVAATEFAFAAVGDVHGQMHSMVRLVEGRAKRASLEMSFVLQVGDFEPHRHEADLTTMAAPSKYKQLGDFATFHAGKSRFPWPVFFIGGNHEPHGFLEISPDGFELFSACTYLGRVGLLEWNGLRIAGLSGIYKEDSFQDLRPSVSSLGTVSNKVFAYFNEQDVERALEFERVDVLLLHEWPADIIDPAHEAEFEGQRRSLRYDHVGNPYARMLVDALEPQLVLCGHMHKAYRAEVRHASGRGLGGGVLAGGGKGKGRVALFGG